MHGLHPHPATPPPPSPAEATRQYLHALVDSDALVALHFSCNPVPVHGGRGVFGEVQFRLAHPAAFAFGRGDLDALEEALARAAREKHRGDGPPGKESPLFGHFGGGS